MTPEVEHHIPARTKARPLSAQYRIASALGAASTTSALTPWAGFSLVGLVATLVARLLLATPCRRRSMLALPARSIPAFRPPGLLARWAAPTPPIAQAGNGLWIIRYLMIRRLTFAALAWSAAHSLRCPAA